MAICFPQVIKLTILHERVYIRNGWLVDYVNELSEQDTLKIKT